MNLAGCDVVLLYFSDKIFQRVAFFDIEFFAQTIAVGVDACRGDGQHLGNFFGAHANSYVCAKAEVVFSEFFGSPLELDKK